MHGGCHRIPHRSPIGCELSSASPSSSQKPKSYKTAIGGKSDPRHYERLASDTDRGFIQCSVGSTEPHMTSATMETQTCFFKNAVPDFSGVRSSGVATDCIPAFVFTAICILC